jgi:integrase
MPHRRRALTDPEAAFLRAVEERGARPDTVRLYRSTLAQLFFLTGVQAERFGARECARILAAPGVAATQRNRMTTLRVFHAWLAESGRPHRSEVWSAAMPPKPPTEPRPFAAREIRRLRRVAARVSDRQWAAYFTVLDATGCRSFAPLDLDCADLDGVWQARKDGAVRVRFTDDEASPVSEIAAAGRKAAADLVAVLWRYGKARDLDLDGPLFDGRAGSRRSANWVLDRWRQHQALAGVVGELGQVRHTFACEELRRTGDVVRVSRWLGHRAIETTARYAQRLLAANGAAAR